MQCTNGHEVAPEAKFCPKCGARVARCPNGHDVLPGALFCMVCGVALAATEDPAAGTPAAVLPTPVGSDVATDGFSKQSSGGAPPRAKPTPVPLIIVLAVLFIGVVVFWASSSATHIDKTFPAESALSGTSCPAYQDIKTATRIPDVSIDGYLYGAWNVTTKDGEEYSVANGKNAAGTFNIWVLCATGHDYWSPAGASVTITW